MTLTDVNRARALSKYDWPEKLVYITPAAHRIFTKKGSIKDDEETLEIDEDHHFVYVRPKAIIESSGSTSNEHTYTEAFRSFCAHAHGYLFQYMDMSDVVDMSKVTTKSECPHRLYEASRVYVTD